MKTELEQVNYVRNQSPCNEDDVFDEKLTMCMSKKFDDFDIKAMRLEYELLKQGCFDAVEFAAIEGRRNLKLIIESTNSPDPEKRVSALSGAVQYMSRKAVEGAEKFRSLLARSPKPRSSVPLSSPVPPPSSVPLSSPVPFCGAVPTVTECDRQFYATMADLDVYLYELRELLENESDFLSYPTEIDRQRACYDTILASAQERCPADLNPEELAKRRHGYLTLLRESTDSALKTYKRKLLSVEGAIVTTHTNDAAQPAESASAPPRDCWTVIFDETQEQYYFFNDATGKEQWADSGEFANSPPPAAPRGCWIASIDEQSKALYFYNTEAGMSAWAAKPADLSAGSGKRLSGGVFAHAQTVKTGTPEITYTSGEHDVTIQPPAQTTIASVENSQPVAPHPIFGPKLLEDIKTARRLKEELSAAEKQAKPVLSGVQPASAPLEQNSAEHLLAPSPTAADETLPGWQVITDSEGLKSYKHEATGLVSSENPKDHLLADAALHHWAEINLDGEKVFVNTKTGDKSETRPPPPPALPAPRPAHADLLVQTQHAKLNKKNSTADAGRLPRSSESKPARPINAGNQQTSKSVFPGQLTLADQIAKVKLQRTAINGPNQAITTPGGLHTTLEAAIATLRKTQPSTDGETPR